MNLYLISQPKDNVGYDDYDSAIVCAETEDEARMIRPSNDYPWGGKIYNNYSCDDWAKSPDDVTVRLIGVADPSIPRGVVLASFNAG